MCRRLWLRHGFLDDFFFSCCFYCRWLRLDAGGWHWLLDLFFFSCAFGFCWQWLDGWRRRRCRFRRDSCLAHRHGHALGGRLAFSQPRRTVQQHSKTLRCWRHFLRVFIGVYALRELHAEALYPRLHQILGQLRGGFVARVIVVIGDVNPLRSVLREGGPMVGCEAVHAVTGRDVAVARAPKS